MPIQSYVALLRAVNVGGTGKLPMTELKAMAGELGLANVRTYIASGNLVFDSQLPEAEIKAALEARLARHAGKPLGVIIRSADEIRDVLAANPFPEAPGNRSVAIFLDAAPPADALEHARHAGGERMRLGRREIYVHYPQGQGQSKLIIPAAKTGTARNMNTVAKLVEMADAEGAPSARSR
ncbi:uncharacterized protein (DUF1697 family) [Hoeflea marina]|uniref:Uncharacterized protein (DUF1697 family) n=1 Tax=Hoeflea marina TaxID=274592 RepID=A0A317PS32_9HYPH|nr:DUF1697 domain-containing protein [Hoeflea marina]PWW03414.1 uncharacterized protein (DUF1697 family) [Hoeflea marina]